MRTLLLLCSLLSFASAYAQPEPAVLWTRTFGGTGDDRAYDVRETLDGGFIIAGYTTGTLDTDDADVWLIRTDADGDTLWTRLYGGPLHDLAETVEVLPDGGFIVGAVTQSFGAGDFDIWLLRLNRGGDTLWTTTFGGPDYDSIGGIDLTSDGGFVLAGMTMSSGAGEWDILLVKTTSDGVVRWSQTYGGAALDLAGDVCQTADGGYVMAAATNSFGTFCLDPFYLKADSAGGVVWWSWSSLLYEDRVWDLAEMQDGSFWMTGATQSYSQDLTYDGFVVRVADDGAVLGSWAIGGPGHEFFNSIIPYDSGGAVWAGLTQSAADGLSDVYFGAISAGGDTLWTRRAGGMGQDEATCIRMTQDHRYILTGQTNIPGGLRTWDIFLTKTGVDSLEAPDTTATAERPAPDARLPQQLALAAAPNPFNPATVLTIASPAAGKARLSIYDVAGRRVREVFAGSLPAGTHRFALDGSALPSGIYFARLEAAGAVRTRKLVLMK